MTEDTSLKNLWMLRKNAGLSQQALGDRFHLSQQTIYKYENGLAELTRDLRSTYGLDFLIGNVSSEEPEEQPVVLDYTVEEKDIVLKIRKLTPEIRRALTAFLDKLLNEKPDKV